MAWHATPLATWRAKRSKIWIFLILNLSFFPIYLYPNTSLIKKKRTGVKKQNSGKYLGDFTRTRVTKISRISWMRHLPVNWFFTVKGNLFSFIARIPTVLRGREERSKSVIENFVEIERGGRIQCLWKTAYTIVIFKFLI